MAKVAFVKTAERVAGVRAALDLVQASAMTGKQLFLKPNYNSADPTPG